MLAFLQVWLVIAHRLSWQHPSVTFFTSPKVILDLVIALHFRLLFLLRAVSLWNQKPNSLLPPCDFNEFTSRHIQG